MWWWIILLPTPIPTVLLVTLMHSNKGINTQCQQVHTDAHQSLCRSTQRSVCWLLLHKLLSHCPCLPALLHIYKPTVLLCTYANVLIKCAINNSSPAEWNNSQPEAPCLPFDVFIPCCSLSESRRVPGSSLCMFRPAHINIWCLSLHTTAARCPDSVHSGLGHVHSTFSEVYTNLLCDLTWLRIHMMLDVREGVQRGLSARLHVIVCEVKEISDDLVCLAWSCNSSCIYFPTHASFFMH